MSSPRTSAAPRGVLLTNIGSPDAPTTAAVRRYLAEFLGDPAVIKLPRALWLPLLHGVILPLRAPKSAKLYASIWSEHGSPLVHISKRQRELVAAELGAGFHVALAMRYGTPNIASALRELVEAGCREIVHVPMFPQYSYATSGTLDAAVRVELNKLREPPEMRLLSAFFDDVGYLESVATRVREATADMQVDHYVFSLHGLPVSSIKQGDPYLAHCEKTVRALAKELHLEPEQWTLAFQSRFGREPWLEPYMLELVPRLARRYGHVVVVCPGFAADCLETLEEVNVQLGATFRAAGGVEWRVVPCLNEHPRWIRALAALIRRAAR